MSVHADSMEWSSASTDGSRGGGLAPPSPRGVHRWRRALTWCLGLLWLLDAALQYQPYMFTAAFPRDVIRPAGAGSPQWVRGPVDWTASLMAHHIVALNAVFATVQLLIAIGLLWRRTVKVALSASIAWALMVWWLGEGLGGILAGPVSPLAGLPGAVVLYALIAILLWPPSDGPGTRRRSRRVATSGPLGAGAVVVWLVLWAGFALETVLPADRAPGAVHDLVTGMGDGEPGWIAGINAWAGRQLAGHDLAVSVVLAVGFLLIALSVLAPPAAGRVGVIVAVTLSLAIWVIAQDFGEIATGQGTDPNSGLVLVLLAACYWPSRRRPSELPVTSNS